MQQSLHRHHYVVIIVCILLNIHCIKKISSVQVLDFNVICVLIYVLVFFFFVQLTVFNDTVEVCFELRVVDV
jgi:hypothetical protein